MEREWDTKEERAPSLGNSQKADSRKYRIITAVIRAPDTYWGFVSLLRINLFRLGLGLLGSGCLDGIRRSRVLWGSPGRIKGEERGTGGLGRGGLRWQL